MGAVNNSQQMRSWTNQYVKETCQVICQIFRSRFNLTNHMSMGFRKLIHVHMSIDMSKKPPYVKCFDQKPPDCQISHIDPFTPRQSAI